MLTTCEAPVTPLAGLEDLTLRVMGEFDEMPSLRLTLDQAMRLWTLDRSTCLRVLNALIDSCFLQLDRNGRYARYRCDY